MAGENAISDATRVVYPPLTHPDAQIRLLRVSGQGDNLLCESHVFERDDAPGYEAISYTWGEADLSIIKVNGIQTEVRSNCRNALEMRQFCRNPAPWTWIDSLCINQDDLAEKSVQVRMIGSIFSQAGRVIAMLRILNNIAKYIPCILSHVKHSAALIMQEPHIFNSRSIGLARASHLQRTLRWLQSIEDTGEHSFFDCLEAVNRLGNHPYWRRLWVVQELKLAKSRCIMLGWHEINWNAFHTLHAVLQSFVALWWGPGERPEWLKTLMNMEYKKVNSIELTRLNMLVTYEGDAKSMRNLIEVSSELERPDLRDILHWTSSLECSDVRDRVFGLVEAVRWGERGRTPAVDYEKTELQILLEVADIVLTDSSTGNSSFVGNLLQALRIQFYGHQTAEVSSLIDNRRASYANSNKRSRGPSGDCICAESANLPVSYMGTRSVWGFIGPVDEYHLEAYLLVAVNETPARAFNEPQLLWLSADGEQTFRCRWKSSYSCSDLDSDNHTIHAIFGGNISRGDLIVKARHDEDWNWHGTKAFFVARPTDTGLYEIVGHAAIRKVSLSDSKVPNLLSQFTRQSNMLQTDISNYSQQHHNSLSAKLELLVHPEDEVLFNILYSFFHNGDDPSGLVRKLYRALSDSFCRSRVSSFLIPQASSPDSLEMPCICADCGGGRESEATKATTLIRTEYTTYEGVYECFRTSLFRRHRTQWHALPNAKRAPGEE